jgi:hypothetical protein
MDLDNAIYYIKEELLEECIEDLTPQTYDNLDLDGDSYVDDGLYDDWDCDAAAGDDTFSDDDEDNWDN